jgi:GTP pyrophosphokinase
MEMFADIATKQIKLPDLKFFVLENGHLSPIPADKAAVKPLLPEKIGAKKPKETELLVFEDFDGPLQYQFAQCCNPIIGDDVFGFITVDGIVKVHRTNCPNAINMMSKYGYRIVKTRWTRLKEVAIPIDISIRGLDGMGLVQAITSIISGKHKINMQSLNIGANDGVFEGTIRLAVLSTDQLRELIEELKQVEGLISVERLNVS